MFFKLFRKVDGELQLMGVLPTAAKPEARKIWMMNLGKARQA